MRTSIKDRIAKSVFWIVWSRSGVQLLSGISTILVARLWLTPADYGLLALAGIWTTTMSMIAEMGLSAAIIQFKDLEDEELNACYWFMALIGCSGYAGLFLCAPLISDWFDNPALSGVLRATGLILPLISFAVVPDSLLRKRLEFDKLARVHLTAALSAVVTVFVLASNGAGVWALVAGGLISPIVVNIGVLWFVTWRPGFRVGSNRLREILNYSLSTLGSRFCWTVYNQMDAVVLGKLTSEATLGFYSYAKELAMLPVVRGSVVVNQLAFPVLAELQNDQSAMRTAFMKALRIVSGIFFPVCLGMALVTHDAVLVLLTDKWLPIVPMLQLLCVYGSLKSIDVLLPPVLYARYRHRYVLYYTAALVIIMTTAFFIGAMWFGVMGVVLSWVVVYPIVMMGLVREILKELGMSLHSFFQQISGPLLAALAMGIMVVTIQTYVVPFESVNPVVRFLISSIMGAAVYGGVLLVYGGKLIDELKEIILWIFRPKHVGNLEKSSA